MEKVEIKSQFYKETESIIGKSFNSFIRDAIWTFIENILPSWEAQEDLPKDLISTPLDTKRLLIKYKNGSKIRIDFGRKTQYGWSIEGSPSEWEEDEILGWMRVPEI